jgi:thiamine biosynthesis lipoprotein
MRRARPLLGTLVEIRIDAGASSRAVEAAFGAIEKVHRLMSTHEETSDVARINRARTGEVVRVHPWTRRVLERAQQVWTASEGLFDCCVAPHLYEAGYLPRLPGASVPDPRASFGDIEFLPAFSLRLRRPLHVTLDGIAKGFAVDRAVEALRRASARSGAVNAGGDLRVFGAPQPVHVRHGADPSRLIALGSLREAAVASSALYFARAERGGQTTSPIVHPTSGVTYLGESGATVIAADCMTADALTKALLLDPVRGMQAARALGARGLLAAAEGATA